MQTAVQSWPTAPAAQPHPAVPACDCGRGSPLGKSSPRSSKEPDTLSHLSLLEAQTSQTDVGQYFAKMIKVTQGWVHGQRVACVVKGSVLGLMLRSHCHGILNRVFF